jgi:hypothetical protein
MADQFQLKAGDSMLVDPKSSLAGGVVAPVTDDQKKLKALIDRRHPEYDENKDHWDFMEDTYEGGREWFKENIFRYIKEGDTEFADRLARAYRFNHSREVVDLLNKYLFKQVIARNDKDAPEAVQRFWKKATRNGLGIKDLARQISKKASIYGRIGVVIDNTAGKTGPVVSKADEKKNGVRTYAYIVGPEQLLDYAFDEEGLLQWVLIQECSRDDSDPLNSSGDEVERFRLWTKQDWRLFEEVKEGRKKVVKEVDNGHHGLGIVPVVLADNIITDEEYCAPALIDDIAYLDRAVANYLSNLDAIIQDQTFSQLAMPAQNVLPGEDNYTKLTEMGTKRIFLYDGESNTQPFYLSPDPKQAQMILEVINKIISEIYHTVGLAGERTKQDNAMGIDNSSGVAKAFDFERVNALLAAKADSLEVVENKIATIVAKWNGEDIEDDLVSYPDNFDTRGLYDEFDIAARLMLISAPETVRQEQMKSVLDKLFPQLASALRKKMEKELKDWPADPADLTTNPNTADPEKAPGAPSKQGQNPGKKDDQAQA